eukprot:CAMPEP_0117759244 /NCGR_PEP_ID=MMETSP0947-20121206/15900_1 /TAXON_ID=44440 /ORGANISM="Chattonella subsalsa, Strain CCMP2191" /LENGTH=424 /DNA_ID=CAMNT_0005579669 /DNA_START=262 /DNA_END=1536 /DNA_ORIENTATION=-
MGKSKFGCRGKDSTIDLYRDTLQQAKELIPSMDMFFFLGDNVVHSWEGDGFRGPLSEGETLDVIDVSQEMFQTYFQKQDFEYGGINMVIGNGDVAPDYAEGIDNGPMLAYIGELVDREALRQNFTAAELTSLKQMSCSKFPISEYLEAIVINTIYYSPLHNKTVGRESDPMGQFECIKQALTDTRQRNKKSYIVGHIPPVCSSFDGAQQWHDLYVENYFDLMKNFQDVIVAQFFGHTHRNEYRVPDPYSECPSCPPIIIFGGISPMFGNNPTFSVWTVDEVSGFVLKVKAFYTPLEPHVASLSWFELTDTHTDFGIPILNTENLQNFSDTMMEELNQKDVHSQKMVTNYLKYVHSNAGISLDPVVRRWYVCSTYWHATQDAFFNCANNSGQISFENHIAVLGGGPIGNHILEQARLDVQIEHHL